MLAQGQLRGEIRADEPAESLAVILLYAVLFGARRGATIGRPPGSTPLGSLALAVVLRGMRPQGLGQVAEPAEFVACELVDLAGVLLLSAGPGGRRARPR